MHCYKAKTDPVIRGVILRTTSRLILLYIEWPLIAIGKVMWMINLLLNFWNLLLRMF